MYLYAGAFAFAKHDFGLMGMSGYKDDFPGASLAICDRGHLNDVTVYDPGIVAYEESERPRGIPVVDIAFFNYPFTARVNNPWACFEEKILKAMSDETTTDETASHLRLSLLTVRNGVTPDLPMKFAFSLYASLLYCEGAVELSKRMLHGWDRVKCQTCGEDYLFADGWYETI